MHLDIQGRAITNRHSSPVGIFKDAGLIKKSEGGRYIHTIFGKIVFKSSILGITRYARYLEEMKMIETLKQSKKYTDENVRNIFEKLTGFHLPMDDNIITGKENLVEFVWTFEEMQSALLRRIELCKNEILIATRLHNEKIVNSIIHKSKLGINVKILADRDLVNKYFELHCNNKNKPCDLNDKNTTERNNTVGNPWYPNDKHINRHITSIPFGMIILDGKEVGVELVNRNDHANFNCGVLIRDEKASKIMKDYYRKLWDASEPFSQAR